MVATQLLFIFLALLSVIGGIGVVASKQPFYSAISLLLVLICLSGFYILMNAQYLALVNIIVSSGGVMVLILVATRLVRTGQKEEKIKNILAKVAGILTAVLLFVVLMVAVNRSSFAHKLLRPDTNVGLVGPFGRVMFTNYLIPFLVSAVLFLSLLIGVILILKTNYKNSKSLTK